jgi:hypothetical protein
MGATEFLELVFNEPDRLASLGSDELYELASPFLQASAIATLIQVLAGVYIHLTVHRIVASDIAGTPITGPEARRLAVRRMPVMLMAGLIALTVVGVALVAGVIVWLVPFGDPTSALSSGGRAFAALVFLIACVAPAIWLSTSFSMTAPIVAVENPGIVASLRRSLTLVKGRWSPTLGYLIVVGLFGSVSVQLIQLVAIPLANVGDIGLGISLASALGIAAQGLIIAGIGAMWTVWYVDLRSRIEVLTTDDLR